MFPNFACLYVVVQAAVHPALVPLSSCLPHAFLERPIMHMYREHKQQSCSRQQDLATHSHSDASELAPNNIVIEELVPTRKNIHERPRLIDWLALVQLN